MQSTEKKKSNRGALIGAAFLMATSAIGPGFLTQTATFTGSLKDSFGFVILISLIMSAIAQLNIWRVRCSSGLRGQDVANKLVMGLGYFLAALIALGGLAFNIGNVGGGALGFNALLGLDQTLGCILAGLLAIVIFLFKKGQEHRGPGGEVPGRGDDRGHPGGHVPDQAPGGLRRQEHLPSLR